MIRSILYLILLISACAALATPTAPDPTPIGATPLLSGSLAEWYRTQRTETPNAQYFGAYVMAAVGDTLYAGLSVSVPTHDHNGAIIAAYDSNTGLRQIPGYAEQDIDRIVVLDDQIFIPGYDPVAGWDAGNLYILNTHDNSLKLMRYRYAEPHFVAAATTDDRGVYDFENLHASSYSVRFVQPAGWRFTTRQVDYNFSFDSNADADGLYTMCSSASDTSLSFIAPTYEYSIDAGLIADASIPAAVPFDGEQDNHYFDGAPVPLTIGDRVWNDLDGDGIQDDSEPGIPGVRVELYTRDPYFPCVIHANGLWGDPATGEIYYNGGILPDDSLTFRSTDGGADWAFFDQQTSGYWAIDFARNQGTFYQMHRGISVDASLYIFESRLMYSEDGHAWTTFTGASAEQRDSIIMGASTIEPFALDTTNAFITFRGDLIVLHPSGDRLYRFTGGGDYDLIPVDGVDFSGILPDFIDPEYTQFPLSSRDMGLTNHYNVLANANDEQLYVIGADNAVYVTDDLRQWHQVANFQVNGAPVIALTYWPARDAIVAATAGEDANLYLIQR